MHPMIPAEYISNIIYEGPGADSLSAAAEQLRLMYNSANMTAKSLTDRLGELQENWKGSSSDLMADAAGRYLDWLTKHSRQILETAYVIDFLAYVYEETRHKVVPPARCARVSAERDRHGHRGDDPVDRGSGRVCGDRSCAGLLLPGPLETVVGTIGYVHQHGGDRPVGTAGERAAAGAECGRT